MIAIRRSQDRGHFDHGWLDTRHTFSFGDYHDKDYMGFSVLRVINEDVVQAGAGFDTHPHRDMEIITVMLEGELEHRDSGGNVGVLARGDVQAMTAGRGVSHSEKNRSKTEPLRLIQVWIRPSERGLAPAYGERSFPERTRRDVWRALASGDARDGSLRIHQDAAVFATALSAVKELRHALGAGRSAWVQVTRGEGTLNGRRLAEGDGAAATEEKELALVAGKEGVEALLFDLP